LKKQLALCAALALLGVAGTGMAHAQAIYYGPRAYAPTLPPWEIDASVRSAGLVPVALPARRGPVYVVLARDRAGRHMRVVVDARSGNVVSVNPLAAYGGPPARVVTVPPSDVPPVVYGPRGVVAGSAVPVPPRSVPNARLANAPLITGAIDATPAQSARTPLPRPRPTVASAQAPVPTPAAPVVTQAAPTPAPVESSAPPVATQAAKPDPAAAKPETPNMVPVAPLD
jgi:hypothetical protein